MALPAKKEIQVSMMGNELRLSNVDLKQIGFSASDDLIVAVVDGVVMVGTRSVIGDKLLDSIRRGFEEAGVTLEELLEQGERIREQLYEETYGSKVRVTQEVNAEKKTMLEDITQDTIQVNVVDGKLEISQLDPAKFDVSKADELVATVSDGVLMVGTREVIGDIILKRIRDGLAEAGVTTEDLIETGEKIRAELYEETYGSEAK